MDCPIFLKSFATHIKYPAKKPPYGYFILDVR